MGTNYYVHGTPCANACEHCGQGATRIHIGKSSAGWRFLHRAYPEPGWDGQPFPVVDRESWLKLLDLGKVYSEYAVEITKADLLSLIEGKQSGMSHAQLRDRLSYRSDYAADGYDFCSAEFS